jgi:peptide/nickel transport system substrate-binding protein
MNMTDPSPDLAEGERSTVKHPHPILSDIKVRKALSMAIDRQVLVDIGYGAGRPPTCNLVPGAGNVRQPDNTDCIDAGHGRRQGAAGRGRLDRQRRRRRPRQGRQEAEDPLPDLHNPVRQDFQALIKDWWTNSA